MNNIHIYIYVSWARAQYRQFSRINNSEIHETLSDHNYAIFGIFSNIYGEALASLARLLYLRSLTRNILAHAFRFGHTWRVSMVIWV
jgi:hypothetical protein